MMAAPLHTRLAELSPLRVVPEKLSVFSFIKLITLHNLTYVYHHSSPLVCILTSKYLRIQKVPIKFGSLRLAAYPSSQCE
jgi:hypothetical protein